MSISLFLWLLPTLFALLMLLAVGHYDWAWRRRRIMAEASIGLILASSWLLFTTELALGLQILLVLLELWAVLLGARLLFGRLPLLFLRSSTQLNSALTLGVFIVVLDVWLAVQGLGIMPLGYDKVLIFSLLLSIVVGLVFLYQILWTLKHYRLRKLDSAIRMRDLPTVTIAIPARNETHALEACLRAAVASEYPKLEIIVLDDCSQDRSAQIIRSFARDGVRFVQGDVPAEGWLGKNQAQKTLAEQASGEYIVFADVDTHFSPQSIDKLIAYTLSHKQEMVAVLPTRRDGWNAATLLTTLRYYWQIALPLTARRVPVASQCWVVRRDTLKKLGGFDAVRQKIVPEGYFARILFVHDQYRFIVSNEELGITTAKKWSSQIDTAIRFLYPTFRRQPLLVLLGVLVIAALFVTPFVTLMVSPSDMEVLMPAIVASALLWLGYVLVIVRTHSFTWPITLLLMPVSLLQELVLLIVSMLAYEFGDVNWKGRNVCYPVIEKSSRRSSQRS